MEKSAQTNQENLKQKFEQMHEKGPSSWFDSGEEERLSIYQMGRPWKGKTVLEIGCGPGHLCAMIAMAGADYVEGIDYSKEAYNQACYLYCHDNLMFREGSYNELEFHKKFDVIVMQGLLEHLEYPFNQLKTMIDNLLAPGGTVITSSPCFLNMRGYVWMTLATMLQAPMSLTDLHCLHPWQFADFAEEVNMQLSWVTCDKDWAGGARMIEDFRDRLPKVMRDVQKKIKVTIPYRTSDLLQFLKRSSEFFTSEESVGAVAVYRLSPKSS